MRKRLIYSLLLLFVCLFAAPLSWAGTKAPKYVFYFIGDGFGVNQAALAEAYRSARKDGHAFERLAMNTFPVVGLYTTNAANRLVTCSAAAGTALATGSKTKINHIGVGVDSLPLTSIAETFAKRGMKTGVVTSVSIDHATPAAFYAKQDNRSKMFEIGMDLTNSVVDYVAGGSLVVPRKGDTDLYDLARQKGFAVVRDRAGFDALKSGRAIVHPNREQAENAVPYAIDQLPGDLTLVDFVRKGIELLDNPKGFFMMVEGGKIDWSCHANDAATTIHEVIQFDEAIHVALDFYRKHPDQTLIVVCADHETGGLSLGYRPRGYDTSLELLQYQNMSYEAFSDLMTAYFAEKKAAAKFDEVMELVTKHFGLGDAAKGLALSPEETAELKAAFFAAANPLVAYQSESDYKNKYGSYHPVAVTATRILAAKAGVSWTTFSHTAQPLPIRAIGVGAQTFGGYFDNIDIPKKLINGK